MAESDEISDYPGALDTWVTLTDKEDLAEDSDINKLKSAVEAVQTELGTDPAGTLSTLKARLAIALHTNGGLAQGTSFPVSPTPVEGQIFYRTDENTPYVYDGSSWVAFVASNVVKYTSSNTFVAPAGITTVYITAIGAGGGGGGANGSSRGGGGGAGQQIINFPYTVVPGNSYTVTINSGGSGGASGSNGSVGGTTVFDGLTLAGGNFGLANAGGGGAALSPTATGQAGGIQTIAAGGGFTGSGTTGGGGGGSNFGAGGAGGAAAAGSNAAANTGAGGGGGGNVDAGGNGGSGVVIVMY